MPKFSFVVKDQEGKAYKNIVEAGSQAELVDKLQKQGYFIVNIKEHGISARPQKPVQANVKKKFGHTKVKLEDLLTFSRQMATMLESGVTLSRSLGVIKAQVESQKLYNVLNEVHASIEEGGSLSQALGKHPTVFNQFWVSLIEVGEASGTIPSVLGKLAFYMEQQAAFKSTVISAIIYPAILFAVSMGAISFFALFVGPKFEEIFISMKTELPIVTKVLLGLFRFLRSNLLVITGVVIGFVMALKFYIRTYRGRLLFEKLVFRLPAIGEVYKQIIVERFASQMSLLIDAGVPILYALDIAERLVDNNVCALIINNVKEKVREGELLMAPMERSGFFPPMCVQMIMVGEETGELSKMFKHVAAYYQDTVSTFMKRFATIIEPLMLVFMGAIIGTIVVAMFMPMFNLSQIGG